jgi:hypothetical protein
MGQTLPAQTRPTTGQSDNAHRTPQARAILALKLVLVRVRPRGAAWDPFRRGATARAASHRAARCTFLRRAREPSVVRHASRPTRLARSRAPLPPRPASAVQVSFLIICSVILSGFSYALLNSYQLSQFSDAFGTAVATTRQSLVFGYAAKVQGGAVLAAHVAALVAALALPPARAYEAAAQRGSVSRLNSSINSLASSREFLWAPIVNASELSAFNAFAAGVLPAYEGAGAVAAARAAYGVWSPP